MVESFVNELSGRQKRWFAHAIGGMISADGKVAEGEKEYLREAISFLDDTKDVTDILHEVDKGDLPELKPLAVGRELGFHMLSTLVVIANADRELSQSEQDYLRKIGTLLEFPADFVEDVVKWAQTLVKAAAEEHRLAQRAMSLSMNS
ncbi:tellurite resistance TerB family protein [Acanthopleuribacter pedis]|uniref:TerB family tellurite resistance protein n=1 Tax=Acanthopleuribacter pedis TaxID=442870 RepID=A0A8J7QEW9_9BACT|nr:TerB family tellurite resistance protein [Acanthopleuribacter pedis]MBO1323019.1 TerB family tellurite resistance protein [Acanthopleuribacter pedis]